jgi:hypothetical protein
MSEPYPSTSTPIRVVGLREYCEVDGCTFTRKRGTGQWTELAQHASEPVATSSPLCLSLVHHIQGPGEPNHWALYVSRENEAGHIYQVTGDAEHMTYEPSDGTVDILLAEDFLNIYHLAEVTEDQGEVVRQVAEREIPPSAPDRRSVWENCQGWSLRVLGQLVNMGIVRSEKYDMVKDMLQPV